MSRQTPIVAEWQKKFDKVFAFHPDREAIMERILSDELISKGQIDIWFDEAHEATENYIATQLQASACEPEKAA